MFEPLRFHSDFYRRDALSAVAERYRHRVQVELAEIGAEIVARLDAQAPLSDADWQALRDEFCTEALSVTARTLRDAGGDERRQREPAAVPSVPPWTLLAPFEQGSALGLGWVLDSLSPIRSGAATIALRHEHGGTARVTLRRNTGAPLGVAHTAHLDFMLMNGGAGTQQTEESLAQILISVAATLRQRDAIVAADPMLAGLLPHTEGQTARAPGRPGVVANATSARRITPQIDVDNGVVRFEIDETGVSRLALYDAVLTFADSAFVFVSRPAERRIALQLRPRHDASAAALKALARDATRALNHVARGSSPAAEHSAGLPGLARRNVDLTALLAELEAADAATLGLGFQPERGPGHENMRVLNVRGTGACNSACVFCIEKYNPTHRPMPKADATRDLIADSAGAFDMLFFAAGEPTIHPKLFEYVELARSVGFTCFGMSSHFRTMADPRFTLKLLQAGFEYFDIALHAADPAAQLDVNPIGDDGHSLAEALKGLAVLFRLAEALGIRISVTHKIVVTRMNFTGLEPIFRSTYDRGVRHFLIQPVRAMGLAPEIQAKIDISEEEILPHLNAFLSRTEGLGAIIKPYGFSRQGLFAGAHVEVEQNRIKNVYGRARNGDGTAPLPAGSEQRPADARYWVRVQAANHGSFAFATDGSAPVLDEGLGRGARLNFGCRMGSCGMCCARLLEGEVDQRNQIFLTDEQVAQGFVLLCQARPQSDVVLELCTEDEIDQL